MHFTILKKDFLRGLARAHGVADRKSSMPILSNILLETEGTEGLRLSATDLYLGVGASISAKVVEKGSLAVAARTLFDIVKNLPEGEVDFKVDDKQGATIQCGKVRYRIPGMAGDDFPPLPNPGKGAFQEIGAETLGELIALTQYSMSSDDTRPHLAGALMESDGKILRMVTTDGHRLTKAEHTVPDLGKLEMLVPNKGINELRRLIDDIKSDKKKTIGVTTAGGNAFFKTNDVLLSVKLADEKFPPWTKVIPKDHSRRVVLSRVAFADALKRISLVASDKSGGVRLSIEPGVLKLTSENPDVGEGAEEIDVDFAGEAVQIGFNARYIQDVIGALTSDEVCLELKGDLDPGVIKPVGDGVDFVGVIMPMRI